ncbi:MAG: PilZ domain-containing protein [bacterium]|nr:PilZ domain-containing protein [bacterium]
MTSILAHLDHVRQSRDPSVDQRRVPRERVDMVSHIAALGETVRVQIIDISPLGLMCRTDGDIKPGDRVTVWLPLLKDCPAEIRWVEDGRAGMAFLDPIRPRIYDALLALIPPRPTA